MQRRVSDQSGSATTLLLASLLTACGADSSAPSDPALFEDWRDAIVYQLLVDRFDNGDTANDVQAGIAPVPGDLARFQGGDWRGVEQRLPYLEQLGVNTLWISPVVRNVDRTETQDGYHGYWALDFDAPNPRFGSLEDLRALVEAAHARNMRLIIDVVTNHTGRVFNYDLNQDGAISEDEVEPTYASAAPIEAPLIWRACVDGGEACSTLTPHWTVNGESTALAQDDFHRRGAGGFGDDSQLYGDFPTGLRDLDTSQDSVIDALVETYLGWVAQTDVDGFRVDAVPHIEQPFWAKFGSRLREGIAALGKRDFLLLGEVFNRDPAVLASYTDRDELDTVFDFSFKFDLVDRVLLGGDKPSIARQVLEGNRSYFREEPQPLGAGLDPWQLRLVFGDNHDVWRIRGQIDDPYATDLVMTAVFGADGIPAVYYGTEQDFKGQGGHESREVMWTTGFPTDGTSFKVVQALCALRKREPALRYGSLRVLYAADYGGLDTESDAGMLVWQREHDGRRLLVALNGHALQSSRASFRTDYPEGTPLFDALRGNQVTTVQAVGQVSLELPPRGALILAPR
ncbi:MAG: hypothetical protein H6718_23860 [Polyangiaceae bacterium]|nr:hypothetical protein [Myxococcales bacterium]MCB9588465.1 hypothetical protein [Polyangiaceae bacterium]